MREAVQLDKKAMEIWEKLEKRESGVEGYKKRSGLLYFGDCIYVPCVSGLREEILTHFHHSKEGGHSGWLRTYLKVKHFFKWEGLKKELKDMVAKYDIC